MYHGIGNLRAGEDGKLDQVRNLLPVVWLIFSGASFSAATPLPARVPESALEGQALVNAALANEVRAAQDMSHPMRYLLRKSTPRLTTVRLIYETRDGNVARLMSTDGQPLSAADDQKEQNRLAELAVDPERQRHRKQSEAADLGRVLRVLRVLPTAFLYQDAGSGLAGAVSIQKFTFRPNPSFSPPDLESQVLTQMAGELWIDPAQQRVVRLEGHLQNDVDYGWGLLGRLYKGGWIRMDQMDVGGGQWRAVRLEMKMTARVVFRTRVLNTVEEESEFVPLPVSMTYLEAIALLRSERGAAE
jgi:hypothetical protein